MFYSNFNLVYSKFVEHLNDKKLPSNQFVFVRYDLMLSSISSAIDSAMRKLELEPLSSAMKELYDGQQAKVGTLVNDIPCNLM